MSVPSAFNTGTGRNAILRGVLAFFQNVAPWVTTGRKFRMPADVPADQRPALFLSQLDEERSYAGEGFPPSIILNVHAYVYTWAPPDMEVPADQLGDILDSFDKVLAPPILMASKQTLGGLVSHCWIEGKTLLIPGDLQSDGMAVIPLKILIPS